MVLERTQLIIHCGTNMEQLLLIIWMLKTLFVLIC